MRITPSLCTRTVIAGILLWVVMGGHWPPAARGQQRSIQVVPLLTNEDVAQDLHIEDINKHIENTDRNVTKISDKSDATATTVSGIQGEERGIGALLLLLQIVSLVQSARKAKA